MIVWLVLGLLTIGHSMADRRPSHWIVMPNKVVPGLPLSVAFSFLDGQGTVKVQMDLIQDEHHMVVSKTHDFDADKPGIVSLQIPDDLPSQSRYKLLVHGLFGIYFVEEVDLTFTLPKIQESFSIFIQTDKAIYKPGQTVRFRTFGMFSNMTVYNGALNISIFDPKGNKIRQWINKTESMYGVVEDFMLVDSEPILGKWSVVVECKRFGDREVKSFSIDKYVLPKFEVTVELPPYALTTDKDVKGTVKAKYTYGKPVEGTVLIRADLDYPNSPWKDHGNEVMVETHMNMSGEADFVIPLTRISTEVEPYSFVPLVQKLVGYHLTIEASVTESINNLTRNATDSVVFYEKPYIVQFTDSAHYFKRGLPYKTKVTITQADGRPVLSTTQDVKLITYTKFYDAKVHKNRARALPDRMFVPPPSGLLEIDFDAPSNADEIHFEIHYRGFTSTLEVFASHRRYSNPVPKGDMQISMVSSVAAIGEDIEFNVMSNSLLMDDLTYLVVANGLIVESGIVQAVGQKSLNLRFPVSTNMEPFSKLIVYYFGNSTRWNADSLYFSVNDGSDIFKNQVSLGFNASTAKPGEVVAVNVTSSPRALVNVLAVDQSVLLMGTGNDVSQADVIASLKSDTPPSDISMYSSIHFPSSVLKQTSGLTVVSDVYPFTYWGNNHRRRQLDCPPGYRPGGFSTMAPLPFMPTTPAYFPGMFPTAMPGMLPGQTPTAQPGLLPGQFPTALPGATYAPNGAKLPGSGALQQVQRVRSFFPETWMWSNITTGQDGHASLAASVPDTITSWVASAFSVSKTAGLGITASSAKLRTFRPFFVSLNLPYSVVRGEEVVIQANVFNYLGQDQQVTVTLARSNDFKVIVPTGTPGTMQYLSQDVVKNTAVGAGKAVSVFIPIIPSAVGKINVLVKAQTSGAADAVRRQLLVEAEGLLVEENIPFVLAAGDALSVPFIFPPTFVADSQVVRVSVIGDVMGPALQNMDHLLRLPTGCGEQTMTKLAPDVFITNYLTATNQLTDDVRDKAVAYMQRGYQRELTFQHRDGSFSIWGESDYSGSTWLTAFVAKSFHQAKNYIFVSENVLERALNWLVNTQNYDGSFPSRGSVHDVMLKGGATMKYSLTAFVLLALVENDDLENQYYNRRIQQSAARARAYLEARLHNSEVSRPYDLAIVGYALARAGSGSASIAMNRLNAWYKIDKDGKQHWDSNLQPFRPNFTPASTPAPFLPFVHPTPQAALPTVFQPRHWSDYYRRQPPLDIEIAAYGLLYYIETNDLAHGVPVLRWLVSQRNANGGFSSTQDTVMALQALSEYRSVLSGNQNVDIDVAADNFTHHFNVKKQDALVLKTTLIPKNSLQLSQTQAGVPMAINMTASGNGSVLAQVSVSFHVEQEVTNPAYNVTTRIVKETLRSLTIEHCSRDLQGQPMSGMMVLELGVPSGFSVLAETLVANETSVVKKTESQTRAFIVYLDYSQKVVTQNCFTVEMVRTELVAKSKPASIKLYDYYQPENKAITFYESQLLKDASFCDICSTCGC